ncbi:MAG TPA: adenylate/guanylate cyclase domain-containing protein [Ktedonobacterales bacterium]|jgi:adenylate cyclase|nr:adenylate/guanylate cyclase domain-containing protein [Ktedonobacterales bacterium]
MVAGDTGTASGTSDASDAAHRKDATIGSPTDVSDEQTVLLTSSGPLGPSQVVERATTARRRTGADLDAIERELKELAGQMHRHARALEPFVEGSFATDLADPRTRMLADALQVARSADQRLGRLDQLTRELNKTAVGVASDLEAIGQERSRLATLYSIAQQINSSYDLDVLLGRTLALLIDVVRAERGGILLWDETRGALAYAAARDREGQALSEAQMNLSRSVVEQVWSSQTPLVTIDAQADDRLRLNESVVSYGIRSVMCAPLHVREQHVGVVYVDSRRDTRLFAEDSLELLAAFCNQAAIAIENARLVTDLRRNIRELNEIKSYLDNVFASIASGVVTADTIGRVTTMNQAAERILNRSSATSLGHQVDDALAEVADDEVRSAMRRAITERAETLGYELRQDLPERGDLALRLNISPLRQSDGAQEPLGVALTLEDLTELRRSQRQAREIEQLFGRYVHPAVVRQLLADPTAVRLGGETRQISVIFADIRNFTSLAEQLSPDAVVRTLNHYLGILTAAIWQEEGTLTMFIGDALMAIFNAPLPQPDHAARAVRAACAMREALERANEQTLVGQAPVQYGIGVHTGPALVGNIGSSERLQNYTAIGDTVNIAQRLQSNATANHILISADTCAAAGTAILVAQLDPITVKGRTQPLPVYQLDGLREPPSQG